VFKKQFLKPAEKLALTCFIENNVEKIGEKTATGYSLSLY
jgi:hypothetical protein